MLQIGHTRPLKEHYQILPKRGKYAPVFDKLLNLGVGEEFTLRDTACDARSLRAKLWATLTKYPEFMGLLKEAGVRVSMFTSDDNQLLHIRKVELGNEKQG